MTVHHRLALAVALAVTGAGTLAAAVPATAAPVTPARAQAALRAACRPVPSRFERCLVVFRPQFSVNRAIAAGLTGAAATPRGWTPRQLERAYNLPVDRRSHQLVAVSIAYDTPRLAQYLAVYRQH